MKWKVLLTDGLAPVDDKELLKKIDLIDQVGISPQELLNIIPEVDAVIVRSRTKITDSVLSLQGKLKVVGRMGVGVDNIDLKSAVEHGITVVNAPVATTISVAELTIGLMLSLIRDIPKADRTMKSGEWIKRELVGTELYGKTLGLIGIGHIGQAVAERAKAFGMKVIATARTRPPELIKAAGAKPVNFDTLLNQADIISLHIPHTEHTHYLIDEKAIDKMKDGVLIVCAARGGVIQEDALLAALERGKVGGAALDVFETEPPGHNLLVEHPRVIGTPHIGAQTKEAQLRAAYDIVSEVTGALEGEALRWKVA